MRFFHVLRVILLLGVGCHALQKGRTEADSKKCDLVSRPGGYWYCYFYEGDVSVCRVFCRGRDFGYHRCTGGGSFTPLLPNCVAQVGTRPDDRSLPSRQSPDNKTVSPVVASNQGQCLVRVKKRRQGSISCSSTDGSTVCRISCGSHPYRAYECTGGVFLPELPECVMQVNAATRKTKESTADAAPTDTLVGDVQATDGVITETPSELPSVETLESSSQFPQIFPNWLETNPELGERPVRKQHSAEPQHHVEMQRPTEPQHYVEMQRPTEPQHHVEIQRPSEPQHHVEMQRHTEPQYHVEMQHPEMAGDLVWRTYPTFVKNSIASNDPVGTEYSVWG